MDLPFKKSRLSPTDHEIQWLIRICKKYEPEHILELGCGITTWAIYAHSNPKTYISVESIPQKPMGGKKCGWYENIQNVLKHCPNIEIQKTWDYDDKKFDFMFLDSSVGSKVGGLHRDKALIAAESHFADNAIIVVHDWKKRSGKAVKKYVSNSEKYEFLENSKRRGPGVAALRWLG